MLGTITLTVGQPDGVSVAQKEEAPETLDTMTDEVSPQANGEKVEKESPDANSISVVEEKAAEEKATDDGSEVGFKKIFRFVGFKFTLKKDKSEEKDPVKLLTVKDKEEANEAAEETKEEAATAEESVEGKVADAEASTVEAEVTENAENPDTEATDKATKEEGEEKEEGESSPPSQETTISPFRKLFSGGLFSNLRKKASIRKTKEEEEKEAVAEAEAEKKAEVEVDENKETDGEQQETKEEDAETKAEENAELPKEAGEAEEAAATVEPDEKKQEVNQEASPEEVAPAEAELTSSQEKVKLQGSPLKKLFTGAGLKKLSTKKNKSKKDAETKESGDQADQLQSSTESEDGVKADSGASTPEESGEHAVDVEVFQAESSQEVEAEVVTEGEKKKEGIIAWSSFKKLVTPKKRVKRPSESEDEASAEKAAKSSTLSSSESAPLADKSVEEEAKEEKTTEEEKTENTEKLSSSTEEPKKKMDTSVSWEALMCMGGPKRRTRKTSDSEDEETKIEEENQQDAAEVEGETKTEAAITTSQITESEGEVASSCELTSSTERESAWDTLKRMVKPKNKAKAEEKADESPEQVQSDGDAPKDESSFSLKKLFPGRRKKKADKQSTGQSSGEEDSDTPAVVPLSEYEDKDEDEKEKSTEVAETSEDQEKVSAEDRSPSWISAAVDVVDDNQEELSDIPEEGENANTKSADTDTQDDDTEDIVPPPRPSGRRLSTAEVKPLAPAPPAETTAVANQPCSESATEVNSAIPAQICQIPANISVALEDTPIDAAAESIEANLHSDIVETKTNTLLEHHMKDEATAICTGLTTQEIDSIPLEAPATQVLADAMHLSNALTTEVTIDEKPRMPEEATPTEDPLLMAQVAQTETTDLGVIKTLSAENVEMECATECSEANMEIAGVCTTVQETTEVVQLTSVSENSPSLAVIVEPVMSTFETTICTQNVEVSELTVETKEEEILVAGKENTPVEESIEVMTKEVTSALCSTEQSIVTEETEPAVTLVEAKEEVCVITESVVMVAPSCTEVEQVAKLVNESVTIEHSNVVENEKTENAVEAPVAPSSTEVEQVAKLVNESVTIEQSNVAENAVEAQVASASTEVEQVAKFVNESVTIEQSNIAENNKTENAVEAQGMEIAHAVIQEAIDKVAVEVPPSPKPSSTPATIPTPDKAEVTTEEEFEITEAPVIQDTPVPLICEKPAPKPIHLAMEVCDTIPLEVTSSLDGTPHEDETPRKDLNSAVEVQVSANTIVVEEVVDIKEEKDLLEDIKEEEESVEEEKKDKVLEVHMPVQVELQTAEVIEEQTVEVEAVVEFDSNGPVDSSALAEGSASEDQLPESVSTQPEHPQEAAPAEKMASVKCAEVMAQVIEVIEEAVKEIEPATTEITTAS